MEGRTGLETKAVMPRDALEARYEPEPNSGCWLWTGILSYGGYGRVKFKGKHYAAHRVSYEASRGAIPMGLQIDHLCRVRSCINPDHLELVTCRENLLRGNTLQAANARKTHCPAGHPYDVVYAPAERGCRRCKAANTRRFRLKSIR